VLLHTGLLLASQLIDDSEHLNGKAKVGNPPVDIFPCTTPASENVNPGKKIATKYNIAENLP
jgi:hypothetical protein